MVKIFLKSVEAILLRAAPGLLNLGTLLLLGSWLHPADYGIYSTILAAATFVSSIVFGPLMFGIVSQHAKIERAGLADVYESSFVSGAVLMVLALGCCGAIAVLLGSAKWSWLAATMALGFYLTVQELLRVRLRVWAFGAVALLQAALLAGSAWLVIRPHPTVDLALLVFAGSYAIAATASLSLSGFPRLRWPDLRLLSPTALIGGAYTLSVAIEHAFYLGVRYLIYAMGTPQLLGTFSFCVDLAHRLIGFLVSAVSFVTVPAAFKADAQLSTQQFTRELAAGAVVAVGLSGASFAGVLLLRHLGVAASLSGPLFDTRVFAIVSIAVVLNRLKKLVLDPEAMRAERGMLTALGYAASTPLALAFGILAFSLEGGSAAELTYLLGCLLALTITAVALRRVQARARSQAA